MHHALLALRAHRDLAKFDLEDGLLRSIVAQRLTEPSSITRVVVDLATEDQRGVSADDGVAPHELDALVWISADDVADLDPRTLPVPLDHVAAEIAGWMIESVEVRDLDRGWVGTATPGLKLVFLLSAQDGVSDADFDGWLRDTAETCASRMVTGGLSYHRMLSPIVDSPDVDAVVAFWFRSAGRLEEAESYGVFDPVHTAEVVDAEATTRLVTVEHRIHPNPNVWRVDTVDTTAEG